MKLRVIKKGSNYYPQYKGWFGWNYFYEHYTYSDRYMTVYQYVYRDTSEEAIAYCIERERENVKTQEVVWEN